MPVRYGCQLTKSCSRSQERLIFTYVPGPMHQRRFVMTNLSGKTALVTGGSRGIGRAAAVARAKAGAVVLVHYSSGEAEAKAVVAEIRSAGGHADAVAADLAAAD